MATFGGTYTHHAGDRFVFKGGVTWTACWPLTISNGGGVSNPDVYDTDPTWFVGGSFSRAVFDFQNTILSANGGVVINASNITFGNGMDLKRYRARTDQENSTIYSFGSFTGIRITGAIIRDWDLAQPVTNGTGERGGGVWVGGVPIIVDHCELHQLNTGTYVEAGTGIVKPFASGTALYGVPYASFNEIHNCASALHGGGEYHDNNIHDLLDGVDPNAHQAAIVTYVRSFILNNIIHDITGRNAAVELWGATSSGVSNTTDTVYNNVIYRAGVQPCVWIGNDSTLYNTHTVLLYNNTLDAGGGFCFSNRATTNAALGTLDARNNHFITSNSRALNINNPGPDLGGPVINLTNTNNLTQTPSAATSAGYTTTNLYQPTSGAAPTVNIGTSLSSVFTTDRLGVTRPQGGTWDVGGYEWNGSGGGPTPTPVPTPHMTISSTAPVYFGAVQANGTLPDQTWTVTNDGGTGTTLAWSVSGLSSPWSFVGSTSGSLALNASATVTARYRPTVKANDSATITFSDGANTQTAAISGICYPNLGTLNPSLTVNANTGILTAPLADHSGDVYQTTGNDDPTLDGRLSFGFTVPTAGQYKISGLMNCPDGGTNSFFINVDGEPTAPTMISDIVNVTTGFESRDFPWRGNGGFDTPQFNPNLFTLTTGDHELVIRGREANAKLRTITISPLATPPPALSVRMTNFSSGGTAPFVVSPIVSTSGGVGSVSIDYNWGDGTSHTAPPHTYSAAGVYPLVVTATDSYSPAQTATVQATITVDSVPLTGSDTPNSTSGSATLNVTFTGGASGGVAPYTFTRTFGDGATSMAQSPTHGYTTAGVYTETLNIQDSATPTPHTYTVQNTITVSGTPPLVLSFSASPSSGTVPFTATFTPTVSGGSGTGYTFLYSFNDGAIPGTSTLSSPSRNYTVPGIYSVDLTATDSLGNSQTKNISVQAIAPAPTLNASISADPPSGPAPLTTRITVNVSGAGYTLPLTYSVDFGDDSTISTDPAPTHTYNGTDQFNIHATVTDANGLSASATGHIVTSLPASPTALIRIR